MSRVLLDTDVLIEVLRAREPARHFLLDLTRDATRCCSVVTVAELCAGIREVEREATTALVDGLVVLPVKREIAEMAGNLRRAARERTSTLTDCLIAATAVVEAMPVATGNVKDYRLPGVTVMAMPR